MSPNVVALRSTAVASSNGRRCCFGLRCSCGCAFRCFFPPLRISHAAGALFGTRRNTFFARITRILFPNVWRKLGKFGALLLGAIDPDGEGSKFFGFRVCWNFESSRFFLRFRSSLADAREKKFGTSADLEFLPMENAPLPIKCQKQARPVPPNR